MTGVTAAGCEQVNEGIPAEQQAIVQTQNGGPAVLSLQTVPVLEPGAGQVLIRIQAAAVNPIDWKIREGYTPFPTNEPRIPGFDVAGTVVRVGADVTNLEAGDAVFSMLGMPPAGVLNGGYAEYALAPAANTMPKPEDLTDAEAAGIGTVGIAAARLMYRADVQAGERVFINGVSGGVGSAVAQMAKAAGATVIGTASAQNHEWLGSIGVDQAVDYRSEEFTEVVDPVDIYVETVNRDISSDGIVIVKEGGRLVSVVGVPDEDVCEGAGVICTAIGGPPGPDELTEPEYLARALELANQGRFRIKVDRELPLADAGEAQEINRQGRADGKIILRVAE